jgi:predicted nucleotide-binding protein (sugar kinase/HSP70/actin superfamily)
MFVRRDSLSRQNISQKLANKGFATICTPVTEWLQYSDYLYGKGYTSIKQSKKEKIAFQISKYFKNRALKRIRTILSQSGLICSPELNIKNIIKTGKPFISPELTGEAILTIGSAILHIATHVCGVIAIGPFGCMPNRISESILNNSMTKETKITISQKKSDLSKMLSDQTDLPFLAIESDGSPFPQLINAQIETFCLRAKRLHHNMKEN